MGSLCCRPRSPAVVKTPLEDDDLPPSAVKTPLEDDDLLSEILLRLPPQPSSLPRVSLVCKRWHSIACDRGFCRRFRIHHHCKPPLIGFFDRDFGSFQPTLEAPNRVPPGRFSLLSQHGDRFRSLGCRHGLALFIDATQLCFLVWDPVTGDKHLIAIPSGLATHAEKAVISGAVLRTGGDTHFQVVLTTTDPDDEQHRLVRSCVYSSETGLWGDLISTPLPSDVPISRCPYMPTFVFPGKLSVLAGNSIYWMLAGEYFGILEFDLEKQCLRLPVHVLGRGDFWIVRAEGGGLGLLLLTGSILRLWKKTVCDGVASWALGRTIELDRLLSFKTVDITILGIAEENNVVFLWTSGVVFMVHLESLQFKKLFETNHYSRYHPFESVYTAGLGGEHGAANLVNHT